MRKAQEIAGWFINNEYNATNNRDGNLKLNKLLYFAQLISLIKRDKPLFEDDLYAFKNGVVVESVRTQYSNDFFNFVYNARKSNCNFKDKELEILEITKDIFLNVSPNELSELTHEHKSWSEHFYKSKKKASNYDYNKSAAKIDINDYFGKFREDLDLVNNILEAKEEIKEGVSSENMITLNGVSYYYDPNEVVINEYVLNKIKKFPATENAYTLYMDESQGLIIF